MTTQSPSRDGGTNLPTTQNPSTSSVAVPRRRLVVPGLTAAVIAAVTTTLVAALAKATVVDLEAPAGEESIPLFAFAQLTLIFSIIGVALAAGLRRWSKRPATIFVRTAVTLTAISLVPPFLLDADLSTAAVLVLNHLIAATIVIPVLALRLSD